MGNLQTGETKSGKVKGKTKVKIKGKKGKCIEDDFAKIVPELDITIESILPDEEDIPETRPIPPEPPDTLMVNHTWSVNEPGEDETKKPFTTPISSSDSNFTEALTPQAFYRQNDEAVSINVDVPNSTHESFLHNLALNSFKLNEYRARHEEEKTKKLSKLGVSRTSQISLDSDPSECFVSDNVEIIRQLYEDSGFGLDKSADILGSLTKAEQVTEDSQDGDSQVNQMVKRMSDVSLPNGEPH